MKKLFIRMILFFMQFDLMLTRQRMRECGDLISHDEARIHYWQIRLLELEQGGGS